MWCELVINGVGGRTITEAQERMPYSEFIKWVSYRRKRGSMNFGLRMDNGFALLAAMYANAHSKNGGYKTHDFSPYADEPEVDLETAMNHWK